MDTDKNKKAKILLVDDEPNILTALKFLMEQEGYAVKTAENGQSALSLLEEFAADVILLDVMMPGIDGFEVAEKIRANKKLNDSQIIFLTAKGTKDDRKKGYQSGGEIYLAKPFDNDELIDYVEFALKL